MPMDYSKDYKGKFDTTPERTSVKSWTIKNGTNVSTARIDIGKNSLVALKIPASYAAGNITFQSSTAENETLYDVYDANGNIVTLTVSAASRIVSLTGTALQAVSSLRYLAIKTASNTSADRVIEVILKG